MKTCPRCGEDFDPDYVKNKINRIYGEDVYENYYYTEDEEVCVECAMLEISADQGVGEELAEDMESGWYDWVHYRDKTKRLCCLHGLFIFFEPLRYFAGLKRLNRFLNVVDEYTPDSSNLNPRFIQIP